MAASLLLLVLLTSPDAFAASPPQRKTRFEYVVTMTLGATYQSGPFTGSGVVFAKLYATGIAGPNGEAPETFSGKADVKWSNIKFGVSVPDCTFTPAGTPSGSFEVTIKRAAKGFVTVTWVGEGTAGAELACDSGAHSVANVLEPFRETKPTTFTMSSSGGNQLLSGDYSIGQYRHNHNEGQISLRLQKHTKCEDESAKITGVSTASGAPTRLSGLVGTQLYLGQTITADQSVQLTFGDGSTMKIQKGTTVRLEDCTVQPGVPITTSFALSYGSIFLRSGGKVAPKQITTTQMSTGTRGTAFSVTYVNGVETVQVDQGSVWMQRLSAGRLVGRRWVVNRGQTATVRRGKTPVVRRTGTAPPRLKITTPAKNAVAHRRTITVKGTVADPAGVWSVTVNGKAVSVSRSGTWKTTVGLRVGANTITARAINLAGRSSVTRRSVTYRP